MRHPWRLPSSFALQTHDQKMKIDPIGKIISSKSVEFLISIALKSPYLACQLSVFDHR
jgi:hypothetical protein